MFRPDVPLMTRLRGGIVEAEHCGGLVAVNNQGRVILRLGDSDRPGLPRSCAKLFHALPLLASGAARHFNLGDHHIALAAASHAAEPEHLAALSDWAALLGLGERDLACGPDWPLGKHRLPDGGQPTAFHNNNAGKHLAVLTVCRFLSEQIADYCAPDHPAQRRMQDIVRALCDVEAPACTHLDNCGMPTFAVPLSSLALGAARLADPRNMRPDLREAAAQMLAAIGQAPLFYAGRNRLVSAIISITRGRIIAKGGSEGIVLALDRSKGIGLALKIADGSPEVASAVLIESLASLDLLNGDECESLRARVRRPFQHPFAPDRGQTLVFPWNEQSIEGENA